MASSGTSQKSYEPVATPGDYMVQQGHSHGRSFKRKTSVHERELVTGRGDPNVVRLAQRGMVTLYETLTDSLEVLANRAVGGTKSSPGKSSFHRRDA
jgi:hypothetical protein